MDRPAYLEMLKGQNHADTYPIPTKKSPQCFRRWASPALMICLQPSPRVLPHDTAMDLPEPLTEWELNNHMDELAAGIGRFPRVQGIPGRRKLRSLYPGLLPSTCSAAANSSPPTRLTSRKSARGPSRPYTNTRPWSPACWAWMWPMPPCTTAPPPWPKRC